MATTSTEIITRVFEPTALFGPVYARVYGSNDAPIPVGNVLSVVLEQKEDVETQPDMTVVGGGIHGEMRRVKEIAIKIKMADINATNWARASQGSVTGVDSGTVTNEPHIVTRGGLIKTDNKGPSAVVLKKGVTTIPAAGNYELRASGIFIYDNAAELADGDAITLDYAHGAMAVIQALTKKAAQLELTIEGMNEGGETDENGNPRISVIEIWRASQGVAASISLMAEKGFMNLDVSGSVLKDPTRTGDNVSKFYQVTKN